MKEKSENDIPIFTYRDYINRPFKKQSIMNFLEQTLKLPEEEIQNNYEQILNKYISLKKNKETNYEELGLLRKITLKIFTENNNGVIDVENFSKAILFIVQKIDEGYFYRDLIKEIFLSFFENFNNEQISKIGENISLKFYSNFLFLYVDYFEYSLQTKENAIIEDDFIAQIFNFVTKTSQETLLVRQIKNIIAKEREKYAIPNMKRYEKYIPKDYSKKTKRMNKATFEKFVNDLMKLKFLNGNIPEEYCDFIIKQKLDINSLLNKDIDKYFQFLKRILEDKSNAILEKKGITEYSFEFFNEKMVKEKYGYHDYKDRIIGFNENLLYNLNETNTRILDTMYHEIQHAIQSENFNLIDYRKIDGITYNMLKEEIIKLYDREFYDRNYTRMYAEIDARLAGARGEAEYLIYLGIPQDKLIKRDHVLLKDCYEHRRKIEEENELYAVNKIKQNGEIISISEFANKKIKENPKILKSYPILKIEYKDNGQRKSTTELLAYAGWEGNENAQQIYTKIFEANIKLDLNEIIEALEYIEYVLENENQYSKRVINYINLIIENQIMYSLFGIDIKNEKVKKIIELLKSIGEKHSKIKTSDLIKLKLGELLENGHFEMKLKVDKTLSQNAIFYIANRKIKSMEDLEETLKSMQKLVQDVDSYIFAEAFKKIFENILNRSNNMDVLTVLNKCLNITPQKIKVDIIELFIKQMSADMQIMYMPKIIKDIYCKLSKVNFYTTKRLYTLINPEVYEKVPDFLEIVFKNIESPGKIAFLKGATTVEEYKEVIAEAKRKKANYEELKGGMNDIIEDEGFKGNPNIIDMLFVQIINLNNLDRKYAITFFYLFAGIEVIEGYTEKILTYIFLENELIPKKDIGWVFESLVYQISIKKSINKSMVIKQIEKVKKQVEKKQRKQNREYEEKKLSEMKALENIRQNVSKDEMEEGQASIKRFLRKKLNLKGRGSDIFESSSQLKER